MTVTLSPISKFLLLVLPYRLISFFSLSCMSQAIHLELEVPDDLARLRLPAGVQQRLTELLDKQDTGTMLTDAKRHQAEGLVDLAELLWLLRLQSERMSSRSG